MRDLPPTPRVLTATPNHATANVLETADEQKSAVSDAKLGAPGHLFLQDLNWTIVLACQSHISGFLLLLAIEFLEEIGVLFSADCIEAR